jgi:hypothetical protein
MDGIRVSDASVSTSRAEGSALGLMREGMWLTAVVPSCTSEVECTRSKLCEAFYKLKCSLVSLSPGVG